MMEGTVLRKNRREAYLEVGNKRKEGRKEGQDALVLVVVQVVPQLISRHSEPAGPRDNRPLSVPRVSRCQAAAKEEGAAQDGVGGVVPGSGIDDEDGHGFLVERSGPLLPDDVPLVLNARGSDREAEEHGGVGAEGEVGGAEGGGSGGFAV